MTNIIKLTFINKRATKLNKPCVFYHVEIDQDIGYTESVELEFG